jgi:hypothetical protein
VQKFLRGFDFVFFFLLGLLGALILTLWIIRIDDVCRNNFNILWAVPTHLIVSPFINGKRNWVRKYFLFACILTVLLLLTWFFIPQQLNWAVAPILIIIIARTYSRFRVQSRLVSGPVTGK